GQAAVANVRRKLNLILLDDGAGLILDIIRFVVLAGLSVVWLLRYIQIGRQLWSGLKDRMFIIGFPGGLLAEGVICGRVLVLIALSEHGRVLQRERILAPLDCCFCFAPDPDAHAFGKHYQSRWIMKSKCKAGSKGR